MPTQTNLLSWHWGGPAMGGGREGVEGILLLPGDFVAEVRGGALPLWADTTVISLPINLPFWSRRGSQMEEGSGFNPAFKWLQGINQARAQLECELAQKAQRLVQDMMISRSSLPGSKRDSEHRWLKRQTPPFRRSFLRWAWLPRSSCCPGASPPHFAFTTFMKHWPPPCNRKRTSPQLSLYPHWRTHRLLTPSDSPAHQTGTPCLPVPPFLDMPFVGTLSVGVPFWGSVLAPHRKSRTTSPAVPSVINVTSGPMSIPKRLRLGVNAALHRAMKTCPTWYQRLNPALNLKSRSLPIPPSSPSKATTDPDDGTVVGTLRSTRN